MKKLYLFCVVLAITIIGYSQRSERPNLELGLIAQVNQGNSYITFPTDIGNMEALMFEGNVIPSFMIRQNKESRLLGVLTPQIIIRMYNEFSHPVKTPSYIPQVTAYYLIGNKKQKELLTVYGRLAHHSNGQNDDLILEDGTMNYNSGDFSTNYFEAGGIVTSLNKKTNAVLFLKTSFEYHPENSAHRLFEGRFSRYRWHNEFSAFKLPRKGEVDKQKAAISLDFNTTWFFGDLAGTPNFSFDRLQTSLTFSYYPKFLDEIGLFVQLYSGKDYYNVYFDKNRSMIRFGFMTDKLRFLNPNYDGITTKRFTNKHLVYQKIESYFNLKIQFVSGNYASVINILTAVSYRKVT